MKFKIHINMCIELDALGICAAVEILGLLCTQMFYVSALTFVLRRCSSTSCITISICPMR